MDKKEAERIYHLAEQEIGDITRCARRQVRGRYEEVETDIINRLCAGEYDETVDVKSPEEAFRLAITFGPEAQNAPMRKTTEAEKVEDIKTELTNTINGILRVHFFKTMPREKAITILSLLSRLTDVLGWEAGDIELFANVSYPVWNYVSFAGDWNDYNPDKPPIYRPDYCPEGADGK